MAANANFGKCLQNPRRYKNFRLCSNRDQHKFQTSKPEYPPFTIFDEDLVGIEMGKKAVELNRPIYAGFAILENAKLQMYQMYYNVLQRVNTY